MKKLFCLLMLVPFLAAAQKVITHTVGPKESLSSIGRLYNINGRELANYNKIDYNKGLSIGQVLKIPVKDGAAAPVTPPPVVKETATVIEKPASKIAIAAILKNNGTPIYHTVAKKETLYHISTLYNKVPVADIKKWNNLTGDGVNEGTRLIVGYTKVGNVATTKETVKTDTKKADEDAKKVAKAAADKMKEAADSLAQKARQETAPPVKNTETVKLPETNVKGSDFRGGVFKSIYEEQAKGKSVVNETGTGGVFKSTSGWEDGKYYCLHNNAAAGTILKITNNATGKVVYAKVLDLITDIKQNNGLIVRLSNAAADALGVVDNKLDCTINYSK